MQCHLAIYCTDSESFKGSFLVVYQVLASCVWSECSRGCSTR